MATISVSSATVRATAASAPPRLSRVPSYSLGHFGTIKEKNDTRLHSSRRFFLPSVASLNLRKLRLQAQGADYSPLPPSEDADDAEDGDFSWSSVVPPFLFPALGGLLFGYDIGATSGASISLQSAELSGTTWFSLSAVQLGLVVSGSLYGALAGSLIAYPTADFLGRRRELIVAAALYLVGGLITGFAPDLVALIIGRFIYGTGIGLEVLGEVLGEVKCPRIKSLNSVEQRL